MLKPTTILFLIAGSVLAVTHILALTFFLYWKYEWFDMPMHLLGGVVVGLLLYTLGDLRMSVVPHRPRFITVMMFVLTAAVAWEVFQVVVGVPKVEDYATDTTLDLLFGGLGGVIAFFVGNQFHKLTL